LRIGRSTLRGVTDRMLPASAAFLCGPKNWPSPNSFWSILFHCCCSTPGLLTSGFLDHQWLVALLQHRAPTCSPLLVSKLQAKKRHHDDKMFAERTRLLQVGMVSWPRDFSFTLHQPQELHAANLSSRMAWAVRNEILTLQHGYKIISEEGNPTNGTAATKPRDSAVFKGCDAGLSEEKGWWG